MTPLVERRQIEGSIKIEVFRTLSDRADRFLQVRGTVLVPAGPFAAPSGRVCQAMPLWPFLGVHCTNTCCVR